jgi:2,5-diketo-D-gluconate reductase A
MIVTLTGIETPALGEDGAVVAAPPRTFVHYLHRRAYRLGAGRAGCVDGGAERVNSVPMIELNDGHEIPQLGLGVFQIPRGETAGTVATALEIGYRHIDTAEGYRNERGVGDGVRASGLDRSEVFVTSKLDNRSHRPDDARRAFAGTLAELGFDYVDLFLIHWPVPSGDFVATWKVLEEFRNDGRARSIGVSNFEVAHLELLARESEVVPALNQIELHPYLQNREVDAYDRSRGIATEAWSPIVQGAVLGDPAVLAIAARLGRSPAQVVLRWHIERSNVVIPKSATPARIRENFELFDFVLTPADRAAIDALDRGEAGRTSLHPNEVREDTW